MYYVTFNQMSLSGLFTQANNSLFPNMWGEWGQLWFTPRFKIRLYENPRIWNPETNQLEHELGSLEFIDFDEYQWNLPWFSAWSQAFITLFLDILGVYNPQQAFKEEVGRALRKLQWQYSYEGLVLGGGGTILPEGGSSDDGNTTRSSGRGRTTQPKRKLQKGGRTKPKPTPRFAGGGIIKPGDIVKDMNST